MRLLHLTLSLSALACLGCNNSSSPQPSSPSPAPSNEVQSDDVYEQNSDQVSQSDNLQTDVNQQVASDNFRGSCQSTYQGNLELCTEFYGASADQFLSECNFSEQGAVEKSTTEKCPQANVREKCSEVSLENVTAKAFIYSSMPAEITCQSLLEPPPSGTYLNPRI